MFSTKIFNPFPSIKTKRLLLRKIEYSDVEDIYEYASVEEVSKYVVWSPHLSQIESLEFINIIMDKYNHSEPAPWGIEHREDKKMIGTVGFSTWNIEHKSGEIGYVLSKEYWNMGLMTEAVQAVLKFGFTKMKLNRIQAHCEPQNTGSTRVLIKNGFKLEGLIRQPLFVKERFVDLNLFSILKREF